MGNVALSKTNASARFGLQSGKNAQERRFARPRGTQERNHLARCNLQVDVGKHFSIAEALSDVFYINAHLYFASSPKSGAAAMTAQKKRGQRKQREQRGCGKGPDGVVVLL